MSKVKLFVLGLLCAAAIAGLGAQTAAWAWAVRAGAEEYDRSHDIAVDSQGNEYVTGMFKATGPSGQRA